MTMSPDENMSPDEGRPARGQWLASLASDIDLRNARLVWLAEGLGARRDARAEALFDGTPGAGVAVFRHWGELSS